jgi:7-cyano-7-deazaguanine reductase
LCPITGAPDYAHITIDYIPNRNLIESKSLKLFMGSFRNEGSFHEKVTATIGMRLWDAADPLWLRVSALFYARGGIPLDVFWVSDSEIPTGVFIPEVDLKPYRGR